MTFLQSVRLVRASLYTLLGVGMLSLGVMYGQSRPPARSSETPIYIPADAFSEALVVVQFQLDKNSPVVEVVVGTVHEFRTQAFEIKQGERKEFVFNSFVKK